MATDMKKYTISSIDMVRGYRIATKELLFILDEMKEGTLENSGETIWSTGAGGAKLAAADRNKGAKFTGNNGFIVGGLLALQSGSEAEVADTAPTILSEAFEVIEVTNVSEIETRYVAVGFVGAEIPFIYTVNSDKSQGKKFVQAEVASATEFAYDPDTKKISLPTGAFNVGDYVMVSYDYYTKGVKFVNKADSFTEDCYIVIDITSQNVCTKALICTKLVMPMAKIDMNSSFTFGNDMAVHSFSCESLSSICSKDRELWHWIFPTE